MSETVKEGGLFTYYTDDVKMVRKNKPEVWSMVEPEGKPQLMFRGYPHVSFIPGEQGDAVPLQKDKFVIDIDSGDTACQDAIKIVNWFSYVYAVDQDQWEIFLSGKKGVHLELSDAIFGTEAGHKFLMLGYKRLAKDIEGELQVTLDTSMYTRGVPKPYRQPNVMREKTGTCKRQIEFSTLYEIGSEDEYRAACCEPGDTWGPEDVSFNGSLAAKLLIYLQEAIQQQELIRLAPALTDEERAKLNTYFPPCMKALSRLTVMAGKPAKTFNDIAIQLTAYAITASIGELSFLEGCSIFIENYPSSSLDTAARRYENSRARYRTMAANGNQHSCGGVLALGISGFDCSTCEMTTTLSVEPVEVMCLADIKDKNLSLNIPEEILNPGGLISIGMKALSAPGMPNIDQYNLPVVLTTLANAAAGKIVHDDIWPNLFNIKIGPTSSGKTSSDTTMTDAINSVPGLGNFYGITDFASGPALMRGMVADPITMIVVDEATSLFKRHDKSDPIGDGKRDALLELYSKSGRRIKKAYADTKNTIEIEFPCLNLTGNATPTILDAIKEEDFNTGIMQRFDFWCYDGPVPQRGIKESGENQELKQFAEGIARIREVMPITENNLTGLRGSRFAPVALGITDGAKHMLGELSVRITDRINATESEGERGIISREYALAIKYAMVHLVATRPVEAMFQPVREENIVYGERVARMLSDWKNVVLRNNVTTGDFHRDCELFKKAIIAVLKTGRRPTFNALKERRHQLKNWPLRHSEEIILMLIKRKEIRKDESKRTTAYELIKPGLGDGL